MSGETFHGRGDADWNVLTDAAVAFLEERARLGKVTSYTEMNTALARRTGFRPFDFESADERAAMGHLLGRAVDRTFPTAEVMISALVHYLDRNDAGPGFYALAADYGLIPQSASAAERWEFWVRHVGAVHDRYRPQRRAR